jgi:hypothetical protein
MTKYCRDCKWCSWKEPNALQKLMPFLIPVEDWLEYAKCLHKTALSNSKTKLSDHLVTGKPSTYRKADYSYCGTMRSLNYDGCNACGEEGKYWEPRDV